MKKVILASFVALMIAVPMALANTAFYEDPKTGMQVTYPFEWRQQSNVPVAQILHIRAPHNEDLAQCKMEAINDERFVIFPKDVIDEVAQRELAEDYWETFVARYNNPNILSIDYQGGLGQGSATYANIEFTNNEDAAGARMRGIYFASLYGDLNVNFACFSRADRFDKWKSTFLSIADTVRFPDRYHNLLSGHYRNFFADGVIYFKVGHKKGGTSSY